MSFCRWARRRELNRYPAWTDNDVLVELKRVLEERIKVSQQTIAEIERLLRAQQVVRIPDRHLNLGLRDPDDEWIIASAAAAKADALVSGDAEILNEKDRAPRAVFSPRQFWLQIRR